MRSFGLFSSVSFITTIFAIVTGCGTGAMTADGSSNSCYPACLDSQTCQNGLCVSPDAGLTTGGSGSTGGSSNVAGTSNVAGQGPDSGVGGDSPGGSSNADTGGESSTGGDANTSGGSDSSTGGKANATGGSTASTGGHANATGGTTSIGGQSSKGGATGTGGGTSVKCSCSSHCPSPQVCTGGYCVTPPPLPCGETADGKATICHFPPGNPGNDHTLTVGASAVPAHLAHGDYVGACGTPCPANTPAWWKN